MGGGRKEEIRQIVKRTGRQITQGRFRKRKENAAVDS